MCLLCCQSKCVLILISYMYEQTKEFLCVAYAERSASTTTRPI